LRRALLSCGAAAAGLALTGIAVASTDHAVIGDAKTVSVPGMSHGKQVILTCPHGERALSGGVVQDGSPDNVVLRASGPLDASGKLAKTRDGDRPVKWYAAVSNQDTSPIDVSFFVVCAPADVIVETSSFKMPQGDGKQKSVACPGARRAVGGGVIRTGASYGVSYVKQDGPTDADGTFASTEDGDVPKAWLSAMQNQGTNKPFKAFAVCAKGSGGTLGVVEGQVTSGTGDLSAECPSGERAIGGGVLHDQSPNADFSLSPTGPLDDTGTPSGTGAGDVPRSWYGGLASISGNMANFKVLAVCE
jgi:hypothetical protein